jgi:hypothetical protein
MRSAARRVAAVLLGCLALLAPTIAPAHADPPIWEVYAVRLPNAYGITISDIGTGPSVSWTFPAATWDCSSTVFGFPATKVEVTCVPKDDTLQYGCPGMYVKADTTGGVAGSRVTCDGGTHNIDSGVASGADHKQGFGDAGDATKVICTAYSGWPGILVPNYHILCLDPSLPTVGS